MENPPFFSIIIPTYNSEKLVSRAIESVLSQGFADVEIFVVDDGSTDNTLLTVSKFKEAVRAVVQENAGPSAARNRGASMATGRYFIFLDSDDWLSIGYLKCFHDVLCKNSAPLALCEIQYVNENGINGRRIQPSKTEQTFSYGICGSFVLSSRLFSELGGYDSQLRFSENTDLFLRMELQRLVVPAQIALVEDARIFIQEMDLRQRNQKYLKTKYQSLKYFMKKHHVFFENNLKYFTLYKRIYAKCARENNDFSEARTAIIAIIKRSPFVLRNYAHYFYLCVPAISTLVEKVKMKGQQENN